VSQRLTSKYVPSTTRKNARMLRCEGIEFTYDDGPVFSFPNFGCHTGDQMLLLGQSGSGKTTLLHLLAGMLQPSSGSIVIDGTAVETLTPSKLDHFRGQNIGIIFQTAHFIDSLSVLDNLIMPQYLSGNSIDRDKALRILERLNLKDKANQAPRRLSVGEQQRIAIARALVNDPKLILADEPTSALDDKNAGEVIGLLREQAEISGATLIIVTHDQRLKDEFEKRVEL
jgi:ABC-type lipoprotein export system ATPase subunit